MKKIRQPVTGKVARAPLVMQLEALECGAASLTMVMAYYDKWVPLEQVREDAAVSRDGSNAKNILAAARKYGFRAKGFAWKRERLMKEGKFPCIIHWDRAHFVVLNGFRGRKAYIQDPAKGTMIIGLEDFDRFYSGVYLQIEPGEDFAPSGKKKSIFSFAKKRLAGAGGLIALFSVTTIAFYVAGALDPLLKEAFIDRVLDANQPEWLWPFIGIVLAIGAVTLVATLVKQIFSYKVLGRLAIESNTSFMWKILRLPISFFSQRMAGDIEERKDTNATIAQTLVEVLAPLLLNSIMVVVYLVLMAQRSWILTLIGVTSIFLNLVVSQMMVRRRLDISRVYARDAARFNAISSKGIEMIETIKSSGAEKGYYHTWSEAKDAASTNQKRLAFITNAYGFIPNLFSMIIQYGLLFLGVYFAMIGEFTVGVLLAFQALLTALMGPTDTILQSGRDIQEMRSSMERVDDVMEYPDDPNVIKTVEQDSYRKKVPDIEVRHLTFGYNKLAAPLIEDFNLTVKAGTTVAIVGGSGCGKSTLAKLISGLYAPWQGEVLFDGKPILEIDRDVFSNMVSVVDQDIFLFEDTIENNLKMWDSTVEDFEMILGANDACIHDAIMERGGYQAPVAEGGKNFSGGERQRLEIARALANDPSVLILDEATSALDAQTEYDIVKAIRGRGVTCVVVAHRLSTIRDADEILVLDGGHVVERGTHEQLMAAEGRYSRLIRNE